MIDWSKTVVAPCIAIFGEPIVYYPATGSPFSINGAFYNAYSEMTFSAEYGTEISTTFPAAGVASADFSSPPAQGDTLEVVRTGKTYKVRVPRPDGKGGIFLVLDYVSG